MFASADSLTRIGEASARRAADQNTKAISRMMMMTSSGPHSDVHERVPTQRSPTHSDRLAVGGDRVGRIGPHAVDSGAAGHHVAVPVADQDPVVALVAVERVGRPGRRASPRTAGRCPGRRSACPCRGRRAARRTPRRRRSSRRRAARGRGRTPVRRRRCRCPAGDDAVVAEAAGDAVVAGPGVDTVVPVAEVDPVVAGEREHAVGAAERRRWCRPPRLPMIRSGPSVPVMSRATAEPAAASVTAPAITVVANRRLR